MNSPFATVEDLATFIQRDLSAAESATASQAIELAEGLIRSRFPLVANYTTLDPVVKLVTLHIAARAMEPVLGVQSESIGTYSVTYHDGVGWLGALYLTAEDMLMLGRYRNGSVSIRTPVVYEPYVCDVES